MTKFKIGDKVWVELQVVEASGDMIQVVSDPNQQPYQTAVLGWAHASDLRSSAGPDIKQAIREVLLSDEFMKAFAAAWMKTPIPLSNPYDTKERERIRSLADYPSFEPTTETPNDQT
jgi:hypothetical protein